MSFEGYVNTDRKPSEVTDFPWLICANDEMERKYGCDDEHSGKWMMFFPITEIDQQWSAACDLFRQGKLTGIFKMKVSTSYKLKGATTKSERVLVFFCGPANNEVAVMEYGKNLLNYIKYKAAKMYYEQQTAAESSIRGQRVYEIDLEIDTIAYYNSSTV